MASFPAFQQIRKPAGRRMEPDRVVDFEHVLAGNRQFGSGLAILVMVVRHYGVQSVVTAGQLHDDEDRVLTAGRFGCRGLGQELGTRPPNEITADPPAKVAKNLRREVIMVDLLQFGELFDPQPN